MGCGIARCAEAASLAWSPSLHAEMASAAHNAETTITAVAGKGPVLGCLFVDWLVPGRIRLPPAPEAHELLAVAPAGNADRQHRADPSSWTTRAVTPLAILFVLSVTVTTTRCLVPSGSVSR